jgi:hypothetical protein
MNDLSFLIVLISIIFIAWLSILASNADERMWRKCRVRTSDLRIQQDITRGKSHLR